MNRASKIKVLIVDDHNVVRAGIAALLNNQPDIQVVGEAADGLDALEKVRELLPNIVLIDISMPSMNGVEATYRIKRQHDGVTNFRAAECRAQLSQRRVAGIGEQKKDDQRDVDAADRSQDYEERRV